MSRNHFACECGSKDFVAMGYVSGRLPYVIRFIPEAIDPNVTRAEVSDTADLDNLDQVEEFDDEITCAVCGRSYDLAQVGVVSDDEPFDP